jgi:hypothetical protein
MGGKILEMSRGWVRYSSCVELSVKRIRLKMIRTKGVDLALP